MTEYFAHKITGPDLLPVIKLLNELDTSELVRRGKAIQLGQPWLAERPWSSTRSLAERAYAGDQSAYEQLGQLNPGFAEAVDRLRTANNIEALRNARTEAQLLLPEFERLMASGDKVAAYDGWRNRLGRLGFDTRRFPANYDEAGIAQLYAMVRQMAGQPPVATSQWVTPYRDASRHGQTDDLGDEMATSNS